MSVEAIYRRVAELPFRTFDDEAVVVDVRARQVHVLNGTGARIWTLLAPERSLDDLVGALAAEFEVQADKAAPAVASFLADLVERGLVTVGPRSGR